MFHSPARAAAQTTTALALLTCFLVARQGSPVAPSTEAPPSTAVIGPERPGDRGGSLLREPVGRTDRQVALPGVGPWRPGQPVEAGQSGGVGQPGGVGTLTSRPAALRMTAAGVGGSRAAEGAAVVAMPESAEESQEWSVRPVSEDEVVVRSLLVGTDEDAPAALVLTADQDGSVYLAYELPDEAQQDGGQRWSVVDAFTPLGPPGGDPSDGRATTRLRLHAHRGGCLVEQGYGERLGVGGCDDPRSRWTAEGLTG
ncbi:hypothetical protein AB0D10_41465 [Kitasatospora sp. NPDC048545]|uniref:hypothetical protein n=1 Tax=Kitasatospora sp. NPDC048545 TaxID=3157208 RepID=UPI0033F11834